MDELNNTKLFKVLYGPLNRVCYVSLHTKPNKSFVLYDELYNQIRRIDLNNIKCFQRRTIQADEHKKTKYILELFWSNESGTALSFSFLTFDECDSLCKSIELTFGVQVYNYGTLNLAFRNNLFKDNELENKNRIKTDNPNREYELYKDFNTRDEFYNTNDAESSINYPDAEYSTKYPIIIEGTLEEGTYLSYRSIKSINSPSFTVYKTEWYLSCSKWTQDQFRTIFTSKDDIFYLKEFMIGHYVMLKVYKAIKTHNNRHYIYTTAIKGPVIPGNFLARDMLLNSVKDLVTHNAQITREDLKKLQTDTSHPPEVQSTTLPKVNPAVSTPPEDTTTVGLADSSPPEVSPAVSSSNYLSLKSRATPGDRGEGRDGSSIMGMMEDGAKDVLDVTSSGMKCSTGPRVEPVADLREAKGEVNRRADGRKTSGGTASRRGEDSDVTSSGLPAADLREAEGEVNKEAVCRTTSGGKENNTGPQVKLNNDINDRLVDSVKNKQGVKSSSPVQKMDNLQSVDVIVTFKELLIADIHLVWSRIQVKKKDDQFDDKEPIISDQLDNRLFLKIKSSTDEFYYITLYLQSTFQRNVIYHSIIFNKHRRHYFSMDRCERDLQQGYYNGIKSAYVKICKTAFQNNT